MTRRKSVTRIGFRRWLGAVGGLRPGDDDDR